MKIAIDTSPLISGHSHRGIGAYTRLLIKALQNLDGLEVIESMVPYQTGADIVHFPYFDLFFMTLPMNKPLPTLVTIHDVIPLVFPRHYPPGIRGNIKFFIQKLSLGNAQKIVTDSGCSSADVVKYLGQHQAKVETVYLAPGPEFKPASAAEIETVKSKYSLSKPYFLYVGDINYNKNLHGLLEASTGLPDSHELVIVSKAFTRNNPAAASLWSSYDRLELNHKVRILSDLENGLPAIYSGAFWYIQPSFYEGFGLPVLEAQACGCPVISTRGGSLAEILNGSALTCGASAQDLKTAYTNALVADRDKFIAAGSMNVNRFSWDKTAAALIKICEGIL